MTYQNKILSVLFLLLIGQFTYGQISEVELVKKTFTAYKNAILNDKGDDAVKNVDSRTIKYYSNILELVKTADSGKVANLSILDKLMVFAIRHKTSKTDIMSFDGKSLLVYAIKSGMVGKNSVSTNSIGEIIIESNFAKGQLIANGHSVPFYFHFYKEDEQWKIDLTSVFPLTTIVFKKIAEESGEAENNFLFSLLEMSSGKKPNKDIWQPIN